MQLPIFISYKRVDKERVFELRDYIERETGLSCWIDLKGIESDAYFRGTIIKAINDCELMLFMYSKTHSAIKNFDKDWTFKELNFAEAKGKRIVFINIDGSPLTDDFLFDYGVKQQVDARDPERLQKLVEDIREWLGAPQPTAVKEDAETFETLYDKDVKRQEDEIAFKRLSQGLKQIVNEGLSGKEHPLATRFICYSKPSCEDAETLFRRGLEYEKTLNYASAVQYYEKAAVQGIAEAQIHLGGLYKIYDPEPGVLRNYTKAAYWYQKAAEQGMATAQYELGRLYEHGRGVRRNYKEAVYWYQMAAEQGYVNAIAALTRLDRI